MKAQKGSTLVTYSFFNLEARMRRVFNATLRTL
jgi:hypothetical protein